MSQPRLLSVLSFVMGGLLAGILNVHAQPTQFDNVCTFFQEIPQTEGVRSTLDEEWVSNDWDAVNRTIYNYSNGNLTEIIFQERSSGNWVNDTRALPTYDNGRLSVCTLQEWDPNKLGDWVNAIRTTRTYDGSGKVEQTLMEFWDDGAGDWENASRSSFTYEDGKIKTRIDEGWDGNNWVNSKRTTNTYDSNSNLTEKLEETWIGSWLNDYRTTNTYDSSNRLTETLEEDWDVAASSWVNDWLTTYTYVSKATTVTAVEQEWDGNNWANVERTTTQVNDDDLPTEAITDTWAGGWIRETRAETTYIPINGVSKIEISLEQTCISGCPESQTPTWENSSRTRFSYTELLPVELTSFTVTETEGAALLTWATASETNNAGFHVQRRLGPDAPFEPIGFVEGQGTTRAPQHYQFTDPALPYAGPQTITYRLKQVDVDGAFAYSPAVELTVGTPQRLVLHDPFPNPFRSQTTIRYEVPRAGPVHLAVYNALGQRVVRLVDGVQPVGRREITFDASGLASGLYFIRLDVRGQSLTRHMTVVR